MTVPRAMPLQMEPDTAAGTKLVELAERHAIEAEDGAAQRDRDAAFPSEIIESMKASGFITGVVPVDHGGLGVSSLRDMAIAISRLGRTDASLAIAVQMHFSITYFAARSARMWKASDTPENAASYDLFLGFLGGGAIALSNHTEAGTDLYHPLVTATPSGDGWVLNGRKTFGTLSPAADVMIVSCRIAHADAPPEVGTAVVFRGSEGQTIHDNWNGLGMRASGSHDVSYDNCPVPDGFLSFEGPWGEVTERSLEIASAANVGLQAAFVGIAEAARWHAVDAVTTRTRQPSGAVLATRAGIQHGMAELEVALASARANLDWISRILDRHFQGPVARQTFDELHALNAQFQACKLTINRACLDVVDKAMQLTGGAGYLAAHPLSRLYRDVRAAPHMQAFSPNEAYEVIGQQSLGQPIRFSP